MIITAGLLNAIQPGVENVDLLVERLNLAADMFGIDTPRRVFHWLAQIAHESHLKPVSENLNYSAPGLITTFRFSPVSALKYARQPEAIANKAYALKNGNGDEHSGDGWKYRGRGFLQLTGRGNYRFYGNFLGFDLERNPDLALQYGVGAYVAGAFFTVRGILPYCDRNDIVAITKLVNGGKHGLAERTARLARAVAYTGIQV